MSTARPTATTCEHACGERSVAEESQSPGALDKLLAVAYGMFFLFLAVAGSLWIVSDLSDTLLQ